MKTSKRSIFLMILFTLITPLAQTLMKISAEKGFFNFYLIFSLMLYGLGTLMFIVALKGGELSVLYPIMSLSFVWVMTISYFFLKEIISPKEIFGTILIISGISLIGIGGKK